MELFNAILPTFAVVLSLWFLVLVYVFSTSVLLKKVNKQPFGTMSCTCIYWSFVTILCACVQIEKWHPKRSHS